MVRTVEIQCRNCGHVIVVEEAQSGDFTAGWCTECDKKYVVDFEDFDEEDD